MRTYYSEIQVKDLHVPRDRYQRDSDRIEQYRKDGWNEKLYRPICVAKHGAKYWVVDGGHRAELAKLFGIPRLQAKVYDGISYEEEAKLFVELNDPRYQKAVTPLQRLRGETESKDSDALALQRVVKALGFKFQASPSRNNIQGVTAVKRIFATYGPYVLQQALHIIRESWDGDEGSTQSQIISGAARFIVTYSNDPTVGRPMEKVVRDLCVALSKIPVNDLMRTARSFSPKGNAITAESMARAMALYYNKGRRVGRLDENSISRSESTARGFRTRFAKQLASH